MFFPLGYDAICVSTWPCIVAFWLLLGLVYMLLLLGGEESDSSILLLSWSAAITSLTGLEKVLMRETCGISSFGLDSVILW